ncbi:MAG: GTPase HflX [Desulfarculaceae bacterium]|nr:GTPase HflX [Desulfarculaceae bacterium]MCF8073366.1 GTPase HflX [Desulfarculaceae bacterium]MCF8103524.1 GTPase HflX [Desulfarculaceae bacterium]MCF8115777.1 GTPase HflX [Desulfarculaceae bacterium]
MPKVLGHTSGLKPNQLKRLNNLFRRRLPPAELILPEQARDLARLSAELGRPIGLALDRKGAVASVVVGSPHEGIASPDPARLRRGRGRLAGHAWLHTTLGAGGLSPADLGDLGIKRWDLVAAMEVREDGLPGLIHAAHLLPTPVEGADERLLEPFIPGQAPEDLSRLVRALEQELGRSAGAQEVGRSGAALLISVTSGPADEARERLDELAELARSAGLSVVGRVVQRRRKPDPRTLIGPGKLSQVLLKALRSGADVLVLDQDLTPGQARSLAASFSAELKFIDRTQLILDIFAQRAATREGKLQVEMAQLKYLMPRLGARDDGLSRLTGGIGGRGPGETRLEIDRRRVRQRLNRLERDLEQIARQRGRRREARSRGGLPVLSIVGYTNAGKSTLLNALTGSKVKAENRLFATLDPTTRRLRFPREREVIITDTVGFIRDLPQELQRAFAATLEELEQADLLVHVADAANPRVEEQIQAVEAILDQMEFSDAPRLLVLNKADAAPPEALKMLSNRYGGVAVSALKPKSLGPLLERMEEMVAGAGGWSQVPEYGTA